MQKLLFDTWIMTTEPLVEEPKVSGKPEMKESVRDSILKKYAQYAR